MFEITIYSLILARLDYSILSNLIKIGQELWNFCWRAAAALGTNFFIHKSFQTFSKVAKHLRVFQNFRPFLSNKISAKLGSNLTDDLSRFKTYAFKPWSGPFLYERYPLLL